MPASAGAWRPVQVSGSRAALPRPMSTHRPLILRGEGMTMHIVRLSVACMMLLPTALSAQRAGSSVIPLAATDTTYGIMLALDQFARSIRRAEPDIRIYRSPELSAALAGLTTAARARKFMPHEPSLGPLADFMFDSIEVGPTARGKETVVVKARAILASDRSGARRVVLHFQQVSGRWVPVKL